jgi:hypothetical protein
MRTDSALLQVQFRCARSIRRAGLGGANRLGLNIALFYLQHMIWHEGYHHSQIKLALKMNGRSFDDKKIVPLTWGLNKTQTA